MRKLVEVDRKFYRGFVGVFKNIEYEHDSYFRISIYKNDVYLMYVDDIDGINDFRIYADRYYDRLMQWYKYNSVNYLILNCCKF